MTKLLLQYLKGYFKIGCFKYYAMVGFGKVLIFNNAIKL